MEFNMKKLVYLDSAANTPLDREVFNAMKPYMIHTFKGNSHSVHPDGVKAKIAINNARGNIAKILGVKVSEVYFTSGATEANNWVIKSLALTELSKPANERRMHILCSATEHSSVLRTCLSLATLGFEIEIYNCMANGKLNARCIRNKVRPDTLLVCAIAVNNETGVINDVEEMAAYTYKNNKKTLFLADATQLIPLGGSKIKLAKNYPHVDFFTFSAHKFHGPLGIGALIKRDDVELAPLFTGGSQENGLRAGTSNTAGIIGMAAALKNLSSNTRLYCQLSQALDEGLDKINKKYDLSIHRNVSTYTGEEHVININCSSIGNFVDLASTFAIYGIECSSGAACDEADEDDDKPAASHVLLAMGIPENEIHASVRISFNKYNTVNDIQAFCKALEAIIKSRRDSK